MVGFFVGDRICVGEAVCGLFRRGYRWSDAYSGALFWYVAIAKHGAALVDALICTTYKLGYAATVSNATRKGVGWPCTKFNFSNPMTRPCLSFIKITSSPVSSASSSSAGLPNQTVKVLPIRCTLRQSYPNTFWVWYVLTATQANGIQQGAMRRRILY